MPSIEERFQEFHKSNPHVYRELVTLTRTAKDRGSKKVGIRMIWEVMRWNLLLQTKHPDSDFKLNDHYHSRYARLIMKQEPDLAGIFEVRSLKSADQETVGVQVGSCEPTSLV